MGHCSVKQKFAVSKMLHDDVCKGPSASQVLVSVSLPDYNMIVVSCTSLVWDDKL